MAPPHRSIHATNPRTAGRDSIHVDARGPSPHQNTMNQYTSEPEGEEESQGSPKSKMQQLMEDMEGAQRKRRAANKQRVTKAYAKAQVDTRASIHALFDTHEKEAAEVYNDHMSRLKSLVKQKAAIEKAMRDKLEGMRHEYMVHSDALRKVVEYRCRDFR